MLEVWEPSLQPRWAASRREISMRGPHCVMMVMNEEGRARGAYPVAGQEDEEGELDPLQHSHAHLLLTKS